MQHQENRDRVIVVDEDDRAIGIEDKLRAHQDGGRMHRAFSIFIFNRQGQMLLQQRAACKYHFAGLWTNACCSHPQPGETLAAAAHARLCYEMGFDTPLSEIFSFSYHAHDARSGLSECEFDHVFSGQFNGEPEPNPHEVSDWKWMSLGEIKAEMASLPHAYTPWFHIALAQVEAHAGTSTCGRR